MKDKWLLGIAVVLGCATAIVILMPLSMGGESTSTSATPAPTRCVPPDLDRITCTLSASGTKVQVGDVVSFELAVYNPSGTCARLGFLAYILTQSPQLFSAESYVGSGDYQVVRHVVRTVPSSLRETFDLEAVRPGQGTVSGRISFEVMEYRDELGGTEYYWSGCDAGYLDILVEP